MAKILYPYRGFTATDIYNRSSATATKAINGNQVHFSEITTTKINSVINSGSNVLRIITTSNNINKWSGFAPFVRGYIGSGSLNATMSNEKLTSYYNEGSFAGYNHNATAPYIYSYNQSISINSGSYPTFVASISIGELDYPPPAQGVCMAVWDSQNSLVGFTIIDLNTIKDGVDFTVTSNSPVYSSQSFTAGFFIVDNLNQFLQSGGNVVCRVPNTANITFSVAIRVPTYFLFEQNDWNTGTPTYSLTNGTVTWPGGSVNRNITYVQIVAELYNNQTGNVGSYVFWEGQYYAGTYIPAETGYLGLNPIPDYGYSIMLNIYEGE